MDYGVYLWEYRWELFYYLGVFTYLWKFFVVCPALKSSVLRYESIT